MIRTHYDNLKVTRTASNKEIRHAYRSLAQKWHPDKNTHRTEEALDNIKIINEAYRVLSDRKLRQDHDSWIRSHKDEFATVHTGNSDHDDIAQRHHNSSGNAYRQRRKRSRQSEHPYRVSKRDFTLILTAVLAFTAVLGFIALEADNPSGSTVKKSVVIEKSPGGVAGSDNSREIATALSDFFRTSNQTLLLITDADTAITALPRLEQSMSIVVKLADQVAIADGKTKSNASKAVVHGMNSLEPHIVRLQNDSRIWSILYPILNRTLQALRRIAS